MDVSLTRPSCSMLVAASWRRQQWRPERLVGVGQGGRALDHDEAVGGRLMARVAACGELVEGGCESGAVARRDRGAELRNVDRFDGADGLGERDSIDGRIELGRVLEAFLELIELVAGELPVAPGAG